MGYDKNALIIFDRDASKLPSADTKLRWSRDDVTVSSYANTSKTALSASPDLFKDLQIARNKIEGKEVFIGTSGSQIACEFRDVTTNISQIAIIKPETDSKGVTKYSVSAAEVDANGVSKEYADGHKGTLFVLGLLPVYLGDIECQTFFNTLLPFVDADVSDPMWKDETVIHDFGKALVEFTTNVYYRTRNAELHGVNGVNIDLKNIAKLRNNDIGKKTYVPYGNAVNCTPKFFKVADNSKKASGSTSTSGAELVNKYSIISHPLTEEEKKLVPMMAPWYITPAWVETEAKQIQISSMFPIPFRSLLLYGVSGTGKTEGAKAIFSALGLPAVSICCNVDMTMFDFLGQLLPNVNKYGNKSAEQVASNLGIPSFDDVANDFEGTYLQLFGEKPDKYATPEDCYGKIAELMASSKDGDEPDFVYVESEFVKAYRNGWGIEIQEPTIIKRNSVLAGLNKALDNDPGAASITLPTGEIVKRHPDCMVIMTTNQDYDGCNNIQQSVLSRMQNKRMIAQPTEQDLIDRTLSETKFPDKTALSKMARIIKEIGEFCNKKDVTDGVCGPRELCNWAKRAYIDAILNEDDPDIKQIDDVYIIRAAYPTIIEKVSQTAEDQEDAVIEVIQKHFAEDDVMAAKEEYLAGAA